MALLDDGSTVETMYSENSYYLDDLDLVGAPVFLWKGRHICLVYRMNHFRSLPKGLGTID